MDLESVRALKAECAAEVVQPAVEAALSAGLLSMRAQPRVRAAGPLRTMALGIAGDGKSYKLAIRMQRRSLEEDEPLLQRLVERAKGEVDVRYVGRVLPLDQARRTGRAQEASAQDGPWHRQRQRPLLIGSSIAHKAVTAGTLGAFVRHRKSQRTVILSNNHVLANENLARLGDAILQPGPYDGGRASDQVGRLLDFIPLKRAGNLVDAAICSLDPDISVDVAALTGLGKVKGLRKGPLVPGDRVAKVGRTTGVTFGRVTATELDDVVVRYTHGNLSFDDQIEIEGEGIRAFSAGGDSGSMIVDADFRACGLLFAGGDTGGHNGKGLTFANDFSTALTALNLELAV